MVLLRVEFRLTGLAQPPGAEIFDVRHVNRMTFPVLHNRAGKPADRNQAEQLRCPRFELKNRDGVLRAVADKKGFA